VYNNAVSKIKKEIPADMMPKGGVMSGLDSSSISSSARNSNWAGFQAERTVGRVGSGNWDAFPVERLPEIHRAAERWAEKLKGIEKPWLCWCVSNQWCVLQQRLAQYAGWTPVVGNDTNIENPVVLPGSMYVNFNEGLNLPRLLGPFVLEWIFLFTDRLAFWHADFLLSKKDMTKAAKCFEDLQQGELAMPWGSSSPIVRTLARVRPVSNSNRLFEVIGCNTREASLQQYKEGLGFWRGLEKHPNNTSFTSDFPHWEHSIGVSLWARRHPEKHKSPGVDIRTGHANSWKLPGLRETTPKQQLLEQHEDIHRYAQKLGIEDLLDRKCA
jgi:hypothetical protein